jgi:4-alpha-glucanotransferase
VIPRIAGILVPLFSIRSPDDTGIGDIPSLRAMIDLALAAGHRAILLLPMNETPPDEASPYSALTLFAVDPIYIGPRGLPGVAVEDIERARGRLRGVPLSDRATIRSVRLELLDAAFRYFKATGHERAAVESFAAANRDWLDDYAVFRALKERFNFASWEQWPDEALRRRETRAVAEARARLAEPILKYVYWQFLAARQWDEVRNYARARGVMLGGDLAFLPGRDSADVWANQALFDLERSAGAPPDAFNPLGQRWGLPAPRWERMRAQGFPILRRRMRHAHARFDLLRIDHVVGLYRTFVFGAAPDAAGAFSPAVEADQRAQGEELMRVILGEAKGMIVVAEDLGVIPPFVHASLAALGVPGYRLMRWQKLGEGTPQERFIPPSEYPELSLATTSTHDTTTLAQWWYELSADERGQMLRLIGRNSDRASAASMPFDAVHDAVLASLFGARSRLVIVPLQDLFGWRDRINLPGTVGPSNWTWRMPADAVEMQTRPDFRARLNRLRDLVQRSGR